MTINGAPINRPDHDLLLEIKPAKPEDAAALTTIAFAAKRHWGYPERWMEHWRSVLTISPGFIGSHETYIAVINDQIVGFYALGRPETALDLLHLWVSPDWMGQGAGRFLFLHALERTEILCFSELKIESDPNAEAFYLRLGARRVSVNFYEIDQYRRELPVLICEINRAV